MTRIASSWSARLDDPPSCVAFCPAKPEYFVIGTYLLHGKEVGEDENTSDGSAECLNQSSEQKRTGSVILCRLDGTEVRQLQTLPLDSAVLDIEWSPHDSTSGNPLLCVATSTGSLEFFTLDTKHELKAVSSFRVSDSTTLVLDLVWHPHLHDTIGITLSTGEVALCRSTAATEPWEPSARLAVTAISTHSLEPWTLAFTADGTRALSGGDDAVLQCSAVVDQRAAAAPTPHWRDDGRAHSAGVTAILPLSVQLVLTGSYDDRVRLIWTPAAGRRRVLAELDLGGGVWRIRMLPMANVPKVASPPPGGAVSGREAVAESSAGGAVEAEQEPSRSSYVILASCMHAGARIVRLTRRSGTQNRRGDVGRASTPPPHAGRGEGEENEADEDSEWRFEVLARFEEHCSMNYGSDVQPGGSAGAWTIVSTSFYDRLMCVWRFDMDAAP